MPRVGSKQSRVWNPLASQRAIVTFCWLPPESRRTWRWARVSIESASIAPCTRLRSSRMPTGPQRRALLKRGAAMFSAIERCGRSAWSLSAGTSTTPARIAS